MLGLLRVRSSVWWGLVLCLSLLVGAHMVFDILDVDGSDLPNRIFHDPLLPQTSLAETERSFHLIRLPWRPLSWTSGALLLPESSTYFNPQFKSVPRAFRAGLHGAISRVHVSRDSLVTPRPAEEPAKPLVHIV